MPPSSSSAEPRRRSPRSARPAAGTWRKWLIAPNRARTPSRAVLAMTRWPKSDDTRLEIVPTSEIARSSPVIATTVMPRRRQPREPRPPGGRDAPSGLRRRLTKQSEQAAQPEADRDHVEHLDRDVEERVATGRGVAVGDVGNHRPGCSEGDQYGQCRATPAAPQPDGHDRQAGHEDRHRIRATNAPPK